jgi:hypothetical protein
MTLDTSHLASHHIALLGSISPDRATGDVTFVMWAEFPDGKRHNSEAVVHLDGSQVGWSDFRLPMHSADSPPVRITLSVIMVGEGGIILGPVALLDITPPTDAWWSNRSGGWVGAILGTSLGLIGALIGVLGSRPKYLRLASGIMLLAIAVGIVLLLTGIGAVCLKQPYAVYYPLLLSGGLTTAIMAPLFIQARRRQQQNELRKIRALDAS